MRYLRKYNESINYDDILLNCLDLIDNGFEVQELSGALSNFMFRLKRRDKINLSFPVNQNAARYLEENGYIENNFYIINNRHDPDMYSYKIAFKDVEKEITKLQKELLVDLVSITERLARYLRRIDMAVKVSFDNIFQREGDNISFFNEICIDFLFEHATKLIPMLENKKEEYIEHLRWSISLKKYFMNTLKRFNENLSDNEINDLKDLCDAHFAYLYDEGYIVKVENKVDEFGHDGRVKIPYTHIDFRKGNESSDAFTWSDIKDYFIPFAENLHSEYPLAMITFRYVVLHVLKYWVYREYHIEDIVSDTIKQDLKIREISIRI